MRYLSMAFVATFLVSCGGGSQTDTKGNEYEEIADEPTEAQLEALENGTAPVVEITIEANDQMKYNMGTMEVPAGSKVRVTLHNVGEMAKNVMGHNWTLLAEGTDLVSFATAAMAAKDNDYIPADRGAEVIAHTAILGPNETETVEFDAPAPGTYKFLCTFPGHYGLMQGDFIVK